MLKQRRSKSEYIEEVVRKTQLIVLCGVGPSFTVTCLKILKKWLGQIVEALVFVHKKQTIHRFLLLYISNVCVSVSLCLFIFCGLQL